MDVDRARGAAPTRDLEEARPSVSARVMASSGAEGAPTVHPNEDLARRELDAISAGADIKALGEFYADDFVLHYPGRNPLAGEYRSLEDFLARFGALFGEEATVTRALQDALGSDDHAVQLLEVTANARGRSYSWRGVVVMHVLEGRISEAWIHIWDQDGLDEFLNSLTGP